MGSPVFMVSETVNDDHAGVHSHEVFRQINIRRNVLSKLESITFSSYWSRILKATYNLREFVSRTKTQIKFCRRRKAAQAFFRPVVCCTPDKPSFLRQCALSLSSGPQGSIHPLRVQVYTTPFKGKG